MIVWVIGAGGIGRVVAAALTVGGAVTVRLVPLRRARVAELRDGLTVRTTDGVLEARPKVTSLDELAEAPERPDTLLICVKGDGTGAVLPAVAPHLAADSTVVTLQNGLHAYRIAQQLGVERTVGAILAFDGVAVGAREAVQRRADRRILVGGFRGVDPDQVRRTEVVLGACAPVRRTADLGAALWGKLITNAAVNPVSAIARQTVGTALLTEPLRELSIALVGEGVQVAQAVGITLTAENLLGIEPERFVNPDQRLAADFLAAHAGVVALRSTMCRDLDDGRPTEVDWLNGEIVRQGLRANLDTPLHRHVVERVRRLEAGLTPQVAARYPDHTEGR